MKNHKVYEEDVQEDDMLDEDYPAIAEDGISLCVNKTNPEAKSVKSFWNQDHLVC